MRGMPRLRRQRRVDPDPAASMRLLQEVLERPLDPGYESAATRRVEQGLPRSTGQHSVLMVLTLLLVGFVLSVAAITLRAPDPQDAASRDQLRQRIELTGAVGDDYAEQIERLRAQITELEQAALGEAPTGQSEQVRDLGLQVGALALTGPGVILMLDDAPVGEGALGADEPESSERVLAQDLQIVTNGLWSAGAEAIAINDQRLTATSSIRFAGEAIVVDFRGLTRPYLVRVIGDPSTMSEEVTGGETGDYLGELGSDYGLQIEVQANEDEVTVPAAERLSTRVATVAPRRSDAKEDS